MNFSHKRREFRRVFRIMRRPHLLAIFWISATLCSFGQRGNQPSRTFGPPVFLQALNFKSSVPSKGRLDILYRVPYTSFIFVKNQDPSGPAFRARGEIIVDVFDKNGAPVMHSYFHEALEAAEPPAASDPSSEFVQGMASYDLSPGTYKVTIDVSDRESNRNEHNEIPHVLVSDFGSTVPQISDILLTRSPADTSGETTPVNYGNEVPFGDRFNMYAEIMSRDLTDSVHLHLKIYSLSDESHSRNLVLAESLSFLPQTSGKVLSIVHENERVYYKSEFHASDGQRCGIWMKVQADTLEQGSYEAELRASTKDSSGTRTSPFQIRWIDKPVSLRILRNAIDALSYIAEPAELDEIKHSDGKEQESLFNSFWKKRDPTPQTAYNEAEAEYYRRVDHATTTFSTFGQQNGMKTDRGKAYILYGPPSSTSRSLNPSSLPTEVWTYPNLHRRLIFIDKSKQGNYTLAAEEKLN